MLTCLSPPALRGKKNNMNKEKLENLLKQIKEHQSNPFTNYDKFLELLLEAILEEK